MRVLCTKKFLIFAFVFIGIMSIVSTIGYLIDQNDGWDKKPPQLKVEKLSKAP